MSKILFLALACVAGSALAKEVTETVTREGQTPIACHNDTERKVRVCTTTKITTETTTITAPLGKTRPKDDKGA